LSIIYTLAYASCRMAILNGDMVKAAGYLDALVQKSSLYPLRLWDIMGECWRGVLLARQGNVREGARVLSKALADVPEGSFSLHYSRFMGEYALALGQTGEAEKALDAIDKAITVSDRLGERWFFAELLRLKGEIILIAGRPGALMSAEALFLASFELARRQGALSWELRAATSLSQLHYSQERTAEGRDILYPIYSRFSEGFQTIDLRKAKSVLELAP
jgi:predicted ATPase